MTIEEKINAVRAKLHPVMGECVDAATRNLLTVAYHALGYAVNRTIELEHQTPRTRAESPDARTDKPRT